MANKTLFRSLIGKLTPATNARNSELAPAYAFEPRQMLAQYAVTGCLNRTFYASAEEQLSRVLELCQDVEPEFIARTAIYARQKGFMKDLPALLCAVLSVRSPGLLAEVFDRVIDDARMLRNFVQIIRSGVVGRKSLGTLPKRLVLQWLAGRSDDQLFRASVGNDPSLVDIVKMVHPKPQSGSREALYAYLIGRDCQTDRLPDLVRQYEAFKRGETNVVPDVPFQLLTSLNLTKRHWQDIARRAPWQMTRMNLNTFARHEIYTDKALTREIANRLRNAELISKARVYPYQLMVAYTQTTSQVPVSVREALQDAMEISIRNVPRINGQVYVCPDVSGSMQSPVTGHRSGSTSVVKCVDIAALVAAAILQKNQQAEVLPFESQVVNVKLNRRDSVMTNATKLSSLPCGGTNCSAPLELLNARQAKGDLIVYVSDNESWVDSPGYGRFGGSRTQTMTQWSAFKRRNPQAKMVCIDIQPNGTTQAVERDDILNIGGFSDSVFDVIAEFSAGRLNGDHWVGVIEQVSL
jgi:60 kDa SS-A/Ro ribonucleoprotein